MVELRGYQQHVIDQLRDAYASGHGGAILELGTGAGKTVTAAVVAGSATALGGWVLWLAHRRELVAQAADTMRRMGLGVWLESGRIVLATVQSRLDRATAGHSDQPAVIVVDEGHRAMAAGYRAAFTRWPDAFRVLLTGTAWRSDGADFGAVASAVVRGPSVAELTADGWLVPAVYWSIPGVDMGGVRVARGDYRADDLAAAFDRPGLVGDVAATYKRHAADRIGVVFASGVAHAQHVAASMRDAGIPAACIHGALATRERDALLADHRAGRLQVLTSADLLVEGWDFPAVSAVSVARATTSAIVWRQAVGRGLRIADGKADCLILDHGGNALRLGTVDQPLEYTATSAGVRGAARGGVGLLTCDRCFAVLRSQPRPSACERCGELIPPPRSVTGPSVQAGELRKLDAATAGSGKSPTDWKLWRQIDQERKARGYKPGWTWAQYAVRSGARQWGQNADRV